MIGDVPYITINNAKEEYNVTKDEVDEVFKKLALNNLPLEYIMIKKEQIYKHSKASIIIENLNSILNLIGERFDDYNIAVIKNIKDSLFDLHCPFYINANLEDNIDSILNTDKIIYLSFSEIYDLYYSLVVEMNWDDYYTFNDLSPKPKFYMVYEILEDLKYAGIIKSYIGLYDFNKNWNEEIDFNHEIMIFRE